MTVPPHPADAPTRAVATIAAARRVLVTGLVGGDADTAVAACDLAEAIGAAIDPGGPETARISGPIAARIGGVTAAREELRDRADLVLFWFCDPERIEPGFIARFVTGARPHFPPGGPPSPAERRTFAVGPADVVPAGPGHRHLRVPEAAAIDTARLLEARCSSLPVDDAAGDRAAQEAALILAPAVAAARCVALVTDWSDDPVGLGPWSTAALVRSIAHSRPAFALPLADRDDVAMAVCTWRYGAAGAIEVADRRGGRFRPAEGDAVRLISRHEIVCVVVIGSPTAEVARAIERAGTGIAVVRIAADAADVRRYLDAIHGAGEARS